MRRLLPQIFGFWTTLGIVSLLILLNRTLISHVGIDVLEAEIDIKTSRVMVLGFDRRAPRTSPCKKKKGGADALAQRRDGRGLESVTERLFSCHRVPYVVRSAAWWYIQRVLYSLVEGVSYPQTS